MRLYRTPGGAWVGTQADARLACLEEGAHGHAWQEIDVPTDKPGLLRWLNAQRAEAPRSPSGPVLMAPAPAAADMTATAVLSRIDNPGTDVDAIAETICRSRGYALKRFAGAVALAFEGLTL